MCWRDSSCMDPKIVVKSVERLTIQKLKKSYFKRRKECNLKWVDTPSNLPINELLTSLMIFLILVMRFGVKVHSVSVLSFLKYFTVSVLNKAIPLPSISLFNLMKNIIENRSLTISRVSLSISCSSE